MVQSSSGGCEGVLFGFVGKRVIVMAHRVVFYSGSWLGSAGYVFQDNDLVFFGEAYDCWGVFTGAVNALALSGVAVTGECVDLEGDVEDWSSEVLLDTVSNESDFTRALVGESVAMSRSLWGE